MAFRVKFLWNLARGLGACRLYKKPRGSGSYHSSPKSLILNMYALLPLFVFYARRVRTEITLSSICCCWNDVVAAVFKENHSLKRSHC